LLIWESNDSDKSHPALGDTETRIYVTLLLVGAELGDDDPEFNTLIGVARERLKRPWTRRTGLGCSEDCARR
jgi:hypothetical protein